MRTKDKFAWFLIAFAAFQLIKGGGVAGIVPGPRTAVVLHESAEVTPDLAQEFALLRSGENAEYIKAKGHNLLILDDDAKGSDGQPVELVAKLNAEGLKPPAVFILSGDSVLSKQSISSHSGAASVVMGALKGAGG